MKKHILIIVAAIISTEGVGGAEGDGTGLCGDVAATGIHEVVVFLTFGGCGTHTEQTVLRLQDNVHVLR